MVSFRLVMTWYHYDGEFAITDFVWTRDRLLQLELECACLIGSSLIDQTALDLALTAWQKIREINSLPAFRLWTMYLLDASLPTFLMSREANVAAAASIYICLKIFSKMELVSKVMQCLHTTEAEIVPVIKEIINVFKRGGPHPLIQKYYDRSDCRPNIIRAIKVE